VKDLHLIVVGKLSDKNIESLESDYLKRIIAPRFFIHEVKSHSENYDLEAREVLNKLNDILKTDKAYIVLLMEKGKQFNSVDFSKWLFAASATQKIIFIIGGAAGHGQEIVAKANFKLSLSEFTFPHKLARLLLVEQIYRAITIKNNHPYNK
jgi:23S rRNA (pseudouridine1915-N3)-methyltransferase